MSLDELKTLQQKIIKKNKICTIIEIITILILLGVTIPFFLYEKVEIYLFIQVIMCEFLLPIALFSIIKKLINLDDVELFNKNFKKNFVLKALESTFDNIIYTPDKGFEEDFVRNVSMLDTGDLYHANDYISGKYKNIKFEQSDIHIQEEHTSTDSDGNTTTTWITIFRGKLMMFDFNKTFKANIQVTSKYFRANSYCGTRKFHKVKMEDMEFNKDFSVYAQNELEAFYILTPHFMEKIKKITNDLNCETMFSFVDNKLHIAINNNDDSFEPNILKPLNEQEIEEKIKNEISVITNFVDELNLENNLFGKEV